MDNIKTSLLKEMMKSTEPQEDSLEPPHKRRKSGEVFDLCGLGNDEFSHLLKFLPLQDKKNLRETCKGFAERVVILCPEMRKWKIYIYRKWNEDERLYEVRGLKDFEYLEKAKAKGITDLPNVKIHFNAMEISNLNEFKSAVTLLKAWEDKIIGLDIRCWSIEILSLDLSNLERLTLKGTITPVVVEMMSQHAKKLLELNFENFDLTAAEDFGPHATKLKCLRLKNINICSFKPIFDYSKNISKLVINDLFIVENDNSESLILPNLRELMISRDFEGYDLLIKSNAEWLETLHLYSVVVTLTTSLLPMQKLKHFVCRYIDEGTIMNVLEASPSLQTLIATDDFVDDYQDYAGVKLPNLKKVIASVSLRSMDMLKLNSDTLDLIVLGVDNFAELDELPNVNLPQIIVCNNEKVRVMKAEARAEIQAKYPHIQIQFDCWIQDYIIDHLKSRGLETE
eukprot:TRINITY_DN5290_c0_g1_i6.p1 TRINITY_DN5290_c0_g1~~TRINITY_DN5290_c0_g1_i6.p1  ORF type:complete len:454 (-),score=52.19 TRINITY_DN5290_c0_g1_i6:312-1673(-)